MATSHQGRVDVGTKYDNHVARKGIHPLKSSLFLPALETTIRCRVAASAALRGDAETIARWRKQPVVVGAQKMPISFLKHSEDQTILALKTVLRAIELHKLIRSQAGAWEREFADWGVIAAPNLFGRFSIAQTIQRYRLEGAWGVSPQLIPHQSLHAMSGTISQALKIYGPNFGISGGPNAGPEAFLIAGAMMVDRQVPGMWLVLTGYESEWIPALEGRPTTAPMCQAVALALIPGEPNAAGLHLSLGHVRTDAANDLGVSCSTGGITLPHRPDACAALADMPEFQLGLLVEELSAPTGIATGRWRLADAHWLELDLVILEQEGRP
jgi:hypothetical protein